METQSYRPVLDALTQQYDNLGREIKEKMELQAAMGMVRTYFERVSRYDGRDEPYRRAENAETSLIGLYVDFGGARNLLQRILKIGDAAEGKFLNATMVANFLIETGESRGKLNSVRREVGQIFKRHPEYFEPVSTGTVRFLGRNATVLVPPLRGRLPNWTEGNSRNGHTSSESVQGLTDFGQEFDSYMSKERRATEEYDD